MKADRLNPARTDADLKRILELIVLVRRAWEEAADIGVYTSPGELLTLGRGFSDSRPTENMATAPTRRQARQAAKQAAGYVGAARDALEDAADALHLGVLRSDPDVLFEYVTKRAAALDLVRESD